MTDPSPLPPQHLDRYLLGSERLVLAVRRHPARLLEPVLSAVAGLVFAVWVASTIPQAISAVADVVWVAWLLVVGRAVWELLMWRRDWFVATDQRLLLTYGLLTRKVAMMPLAKVTDLSYNRTPVGRVLGYGEFVLESAGQEQALHAVSWLPEPDVLYRRICAELFDPRTRTPQPPAERGAQGRDDRTTRQSGRRKNTTEPVMDTPAGPAATRPAPPPPAPPRPDGTERPRRRLTRRGWRR